MPQNYTAQSAETGYYITSTKCDVPGQIVATADGKGGIPTSSQTLTFNKVIQPPSTLNVTIKGINGLYIALPPDAASGSKLIWSSEPMNWRVDVTSTGAYVIIPMEGQDLYWFTGKLDNVDIGPIVQVKRGSQIRGKENQWAFNEVD